MIDFRKVLLTFTDNPIDQWTIDDAVKGTSIMGGTGSGKTSASGKKIAEKFLREGWGGLVLCAKTDEADLWKSYCKAAGREKDLLIFSKSSKHTAGNNNARDIVFNPVDYELRREGQGASDTNNLTNIFMNIYNLGDRISNGGGDNKKEERYWDAALKRCLNRVIELLKLAQESLSYVNIAKVLQTSSEKVTRTALTDLILKHEQEEKLDISEDADYCLYCLYKAFIKNFITEKDPVLYQAFLQVEMYFTTDLPHMGEKTKTTITEMVYGLAEPFFSGILAQHFSGETNIFPEWAYQHNKIIILDFPIKEYLNAGVIAQSIFKLVFQQAIERRNIKQYPNPVFLWVDEAQYFVNAYDQIFLTTARSSRTATVFLSQSISNYFAIMGAGSDAKARVDSLMGNLSTKIFHANSDAVTNEYASRLIGSIKQNMENVSTQTSHSSLSSAVTEGLSTQFLPQVQPMEFTILKTGGTTNDYLVKGILVESGRVWSNNKNHRVVNFIQNFENE